MRVKCIGSVPMTKETHTMNTTGSIPLPRRYLYLLPLTSPYQKRSPSFYF